MVNFYFDLHFFSCPDVSLGEKSFDEFVSNVSNWSDITSYEWAKIFTHFEDQCALALENLYPSIEQIETCKKTFNRIDIPTDALRTVIQFALEKSIFIEDSLSIKDVLFEHKAITPADEIEKRRPQLRNSFKRFLLLISLNKKFKSKEANCANILLSSACDKGILFQKLRLSILDTQDSELSILQLPLEFQDYLTVYSTSEQIHELIAIKKGLAFPVRIFKPSPKHSRGRPNLNDGNATLLCSDEYAQQLLSKALGENSPFDTRLFAFDSNIKMFAVFHKTIDNEYHGFHLEITSNRIPNSILKKFDLA